MRIGDEPTPLFKDQWWKSDPDWSPDGRRLAFATDRSGSLNLWIRDLARGVDTQVTHFTTSGAPGDSGGDLRVPPHRLGAACPVCRASHGGASHRRAGGPLRGAAASGGRVQPGPAAGAKTPEHRGFLVERARRRRGCTGLVLRDAVTRVDANLRVLIGP